MNNKLKDEHMDELFDAILTLETREECYAFFEDLCTKLELKSMSQRLHVAKLLTQNMVYNDISGDTGASTATISRVKRTLDDGCGGYEMVFERMEK